MDSSYILDSYALIAHFEDESGGEKVRKILKAAQSGETKLYLSVINLGEIFYNTMRERGINKANETKFIIEQLPISIVDADKAITIEAAKLKAKHSIAFADCFAAALGILKKAKVITGDLEFKKLEKDVGIEWLK
ncbi:MAG: type II toxin-antitoxin system VapC family toxin [Nitrospirota bacterium]